MTQNTPPMDWYPDPADQTRERYWDGSQWTHNTRPAQIRPAEAQSHDPWAAQGTTTDAPPAGPWGPVAGAPQQGAPTQPGAPVQPLPYPAMNPYGPGAREMTADGVRLSGWWRRAWASVLDWILTTILTIALGWKWVAPMVTGTRRLYSETKADAQAGRPMPQYTPEMLDPYGFSYGAFVAIEMIFIAVVLVYLMLSWGLRGATPGQSVVGIRVVPAGEGRAPRRLSPVRVLLRAAFLVGLMPIIYLWPILFVSLLMPLFQAKRQTIHDLVARTQVVRSR